MPVRKHFEQDEKAKALLKKVKVGKAFLCRGACDIFLYKSLIMKLLSAPAAVLQGDKVGCQKTDCPDLLVVDFSKFESGIEWRLHFPASRWM